MLIIQKILLVIVLLIYLIGIILIYLEKPLRRFFSERIMIALAIVCIVAWLISPSFSVFYLLAHILVIMALLMVVVKLKQQKLNKAYITVLMIAFVLIILVYVVSPFY